LRIVRGMKTNLTIRLESEDRRRLDEIAAAESNTVTGVLRHCLRLGFRAYDAKREAEAAAALEF